MTNEALTLVSEMKRSMMTLKEMGYRVVIQSNDGTVRVEGPYDTPEGAKEIYAIFGVTASIR